jgi:hypothetical protein
MKDDLNIPPARDLPPGHRRQRREHLLSELSRTEHERRRRPKVLLAVTAGVVVLVVAMVGVYAGWGWRILTPPENFAEGSSRWHFSDPKDMVATSDLVMLGTVTAVERDGVSDQGDVVYITRLLHVTVEKRLFGTLSGDPVVVEDLGWEKAGGREMPWRVKGMIRLEVGDRAVLFLRKDPTTGRFGLLSDQAGYLVEGPDIANTARTDPMVRRIEEMSVSELERLIDEAAAAVRRGELQPIPEGGRRKPQQSP